MGRIATSEEGMLCIIFNIAYLKTVGYILHGALGKRDVGQVDLLQAFALQRKLGNV